MYAEAGSSPLPRPPPEAPSSTVARDSRLVAPVVSYSRVEGMPWVRSGSLDRSGSWSAAVSSPLAGAVSWRSAPSDRDSGCPAADPACGDDGCDVFSEGGLCGLAKRDDRDLSPLAMPRLHVAGRALRGRAADRVREAARRLCAERVTARSSMATSGSCTEKRKQNYRYRRIPTGDLLVGCCLGELSGGLFDLLPPDASRELL